MRKSTRNVLVAFFVISAVVALVLTGFYMLSKSGQEERVESELPSTEAQKLLAKDLELKYPETPSEVVKLYWRINKCMYNDNAEEKLTNEEFEGLLKQLRMLYDEEFLNIEENSWDNMLAEFTKEKEDFQKSEKMISSYIVQEDKDVSYGTIEGGEGATVYVDVLEMEGEKSVRSRGEFICRKESGGKWKILGWEQLPSEEDKKK